MPQGGIFSDPAESGSRPIRSLTALRTMALGFAILCLVMLIAMVMRELIHDMLHHSSIAALEP